jgi:uncharacterized membrane protein
MRTVTLILGAICLAFGLSFGGMSPSQGQDDQHFLFRACNNYKIPIFLALSFRAAAGSNQWRTTGWYTLKQGCQDMGRYPRPYLYLYADAPDGAIWPGKSISICVAYPGPFDRTTNGGYNCRAGEQLRQFHEVRIQPQTGLYTANFD